MCKQYVPLHCHSHFSLLDGLSSPLKIAQRVKEIGSPASAITDHGSLFGMMAHNNACKKMGIKPITGCCLPGQEIITKHGIKNIEDIHPGDIVLTHKGRYRKVTRTMSRPVATTIYGFKLWGGRQTWVTGEHPLLVRRTNGYSENNNWVRADFIKHGKTPLHYLLRWESYLCFPIHQAESIQIDCKKLLKNYNEYKVVDDKIVKIKCHENDQSTCMGKNINRFIKINDDFVKFLGLFAAEGSYGKNFSSGTLTFNIKERVESIFCKKVLMSLGIESTERIREDKSIRERTFHHTIFGKILYELVGKLAKNKRLHPILMNMPPHLVKRFIEGLLIGDGSFYKNDSVQIKLASKTMIWQLRTLLSKFGFISTISHIQQKPGTLLKSNKTTKDIYDSWAIRWHWRSDNTYTDCDESYVYLPIRDIETKHYEGRVFNFEVEEDHSYVSDIIMHNCELYMCKHDPSIKNNDNNKRNHLTVLAKNQTGVETLMALTSATNQPEWFYRKPRIDLKNLANFSKEGNLICLSGCLAGELSESLFTSLKEACLVGADANRIDYVRSLLVDDWMEISAAIIRKYQAAFGKENYYIELQEEGMIAQKVVVECLRKIAEQLNIPTVATLDSHYTHKQDAEDHRILLYSQLHTSAEQQEQIRQQSGDVMAFFYLDNFYIFDYEEMCQHYTTKEIEMSLEIADRIKPSDMSRKPCLPKFTKDDPNVMLRKICNQEAKKKFGDLSEDAKDVYRKRLDRELRIIKEANLADYFLIVCDICKFVDRNNGPRGKGRGSGAGSLVNYLTNITQVDPIEYDLLFERFYNASRNIPPHFNSSHVSFMDWYSENFEVLQNLNIDKERSLISKYLGARIKSGKTKFTPRIKLEVEWIDNNNPYMWVYLRHLQEMKSYQENPNNSHLLFGLALSKTLDEDKEFNPHLGHTSLPDIDIDVGVEFRTKVIDYLIDKWGEKYVAQMITFGRLQGKAALKEVFRAQPDLVKHLMRVKATKEGKDPNDISLTPFDLCNEITKHIPDEAAIADELQEIRKANDDPDYGILNWSIDNVSQVEKEYKWFKPLFDQAMRLEGVKKSQSKHAAGVVVADRPIAEMVPLAYDAKNKTRVVGVEMEDAEKMGCVKLDILGILALDKIWHCMDMINNG